MDLKEPIKRQINKIRRATIAAIGLLPPNFECQPLCSATYLT